MFQLYQSNKIEVLLAQLVTLLMKQESDPLQSQVVVVENPGLAHWLKMQMAQSLGIAANIEFPMPSRFFWQVQRSLQPDLDDQSVFAKDTLTWLINECLQDGELLSKPSFKLLHSYLDAGEQASESHSAGVNNASLNAVKLYRLSTTIADLYDQYLVFRPDWIESWQSGCYEMDGEPLGEQQWQAELWVELINRAKDKGLSTNHRGSMLQDFLEVLERGDNIQSLPKEVIFFGFSTLPKHQIETLNLLSQNMDVHVLSPNPSQHYWGDVLDETVQAKLRLRNKSVELVDAGNDLLASLGSMGKDFQRLLLENDKIQEHALFVENDGDSLLSQIQNQILNLQQAKDSKAVLNVGDDSIQIVGCHSAMREVEVLHDHLLTLFSDKTLDPQDIVVMIPDVASYAPYIDAVFNSASHTIPYSISDRPAQAEHPLLNAFITLLNLPDGRLRFSDVISLLEIPAVYRAFSIDEFQIPKLKSWLTEAGVRWGFDGDHRAKQGVPKWDQNTWLYGFKRLLMGYAVNSHESINGISPVHSVEGLDAALLGPMMQFVQKLHGFIEEGRNVKSAPEWTQYIHQFVKDMFDVVDSEQEVIEHIYLALEAWAQSIQSVDYQNDIHFSVLADGLKQRLQQSGGSQHFMVGKVNFCTLLPMRSIPFKVVAVLGLNDQDYPRSVTPNSLDLMRFKHRLGDRSRRDEDRYLFLEAILSARQSLWLSYKSRDQKENKAMTPSVVLAEMMDYLQEGFHYPDNVKPLDNLFTQHPLQPFNQAYFSDQSKLYSYNHHWLAAHESPNEPIEPNPPIAEVTENSEVILDDLIQFYQNPAKTYLNNVLSINLSLWGDTQENEEPFELDGLTQFQIKDQVISSYIRSLAIANGPENTKHLAEGQLAFGEIGDKQWAGVQVAVAPILQQCEQVMSSAQAPAIEINLPVLSSNSRLLGWLSNVYGDNLINVVPSKLKAKHMMQLILQQAALVAMGHRKVAKLICQDCVVSIQPSDRALAKEYLTKLMSLYQHNVNQPIKLLPETAWQLYRPAKKGGKAYNNESHSQKAFVGVSGDFGMAGEREDIHMVRCFGELEAIPLETIELGEIFFSQWIDLMEITAHES